MPRTKKISRKKGAASPADSLQGLADEAAAAVVAEAAANAAAAWNGGNNDNDDESISGPEEEEEEDDPVSEDEILNAALGKKPAAKKKAAAGGGKKKASAAASRKKTPTKSKSKAKAKAKTSPKKPASAASSPSPGAKRTKPAGESQREAQFRCREARTQGLAMLAPLNLDDRESDLNAAGRRTLRDTEDDEYISPLNCLVRSQIEIFQANEDHAKAAFVDQVGLRCVNCATACMDDPDTARAAAGAEKFPQCMNNIGAAIRNWHRTHIVHCPYRPPEIVPIYDALRDMQVRAGNKGINYYALANDRLDLIDVSSGTISGVALKPKSKQVMAHSSGMAFAKNRSGRKSKGGGGGGEGGDTPTPKKKKKKLGKEPKASVAAILDGTASGSPAPFRSNPDRTTKKVYGSDEYLSEFSDNEDADDKKEESSSEEEIEVTSSEEEESDDEEEEEEEEEDSKPKAKKGARKKSGGTPDEYKEVEALDLGTMERVGLYRASADAADQLGIDASNILKACRDGGGYVEQYFIRFANEEGAVHAAEVESVYQPTEEEVQQYIERARKSCADSAAKKRDEDDEAGAESAAASAGDETSEERYGDAVDKLVREVMESQGIKDSAEKDEATEARQQLIRHQLLQRMKMADKAGVSPEQFRKRYMAQLRANDEQDSKTKINKKRRGSGGTKKKRATKTTPKEKSGIPLGRPSSTGRTIGNVRAAAEEALKRKRSGTDSAEGSSPKKKQKKTPPPGKKGAPIVGHWSEEEDILLLEAMAKYGHDWAACAEYVGSRTHIQCKSRNQKMAVKGIVNYD